MLMGGLALGVAIVLTGGGARAQGQSGAGGLGAFLTPWGDPDIQGLFTTDDELGVPFERPEQFGTRETVTDQEFAEREAQAARQTATDAEEFVVPRAGGRGGDGTGPPAHWLERGRPSPDELIASTKVRVASSEATLPSMMAASLPQAARAVG